MAIVAAGQHVEVIALTTDQARCEGSRISKAQVFWCREVRYGTEQTLSVGQFNFFQ